MQTLLIVETTTTSGLLPDPALGLGLRILCAHTGKGTGFFDAGRHRPDFGTSCCEMGGRSSSRLRLVRQAPTA
jgi:hypothetical protein